MDPITLAHEITHVYYMSRQNLRKNYYKLNASNSCFNEIPTYTLELYFYEWLKENKICSSDNKILYNLIFLYIYNEAKKEWHLSPAYDLTYSSSFNGEHATTIDGEGKNPNLDNILSVAKNIGLKEKLAKDIASEIKNKCTSLPKYKK